MDALELLLAKHLDGRIGVADPVPWRLLETPAATRLAMSPAGLSRHCSPFDFFVL
jgi:hypothetical protein